MNSSDLYNIILLFALCVSLYIVIIIVASAIRRHSMGAARTTPPPPPNDGIQIYYIINYSVGTILIVGNLCSRGCDDIIIIVYDNYILYSHRAFRVMHIYSRVIFRV